jgi:gentisate 1,2-dioxygenase
MHTPNASRTILSNEGGYSTVEGEKCSAKRGDLILTPNGTWHGHGNDSGEPVIWMDVLDWPLLETLDCIWIDEEDPSRTANTGIPSADYSQRLYGQGGMLPSFETTARGVGQGNSPLFHYPGTQIRAMLDGLAGEAGDPYEGIHINFTNPVDGAAVFTTLRYGAQLLRPNETTLPKRETASTLYCVLAGRGKTLVGGQELAWEENDIFVIPNHLWRHHENTHSHNSAVLYSVSDAPLLRKLGHYRAQGKTQAGEVVALK